MAPAPFPKVIHVQGGMMALREIDYLHGGPVLNSMPVAS